MLTGQTLALPLDPRSAHEARRWVVSAIRSLEREELVECAELAVSELVTNAVLHASHPITVRLRGTRAHPRVEVSDGSRQPPVLPGAAATDDLDELLATFGRGLNIVAMCSTAWGVALDSDGKTVWFEPATAPHEHVYPQAEVVDDLDLDPEPDPAPARETVPVQLLEVPLELVRRLRGHYLELRREVRLLSLAHRDTYPLARELTDMFTRYERAFPHEVERLVDEALAAGLGTADLRVEVDPEATEVLEQMLEVLDLADVFCRNERMLTLARTPAQRELQEWYLGELVRQAQGEPPLPWAGERPSDASVSAS